MRDLTEIFPAPNPDRFLADPEFAAMRMRQAQAFVDGDTGGYAPQDPRALMAELLAYVRTVAGSDPGSSLRRVRGPDRVVPR